MKHYLFTTNASREYSGVRFERCATVAGSSKGIFATESGEIATKLTSSHPQIREISEDEYLRYKKKSTSSASFIAHDPVFIGSTGKDLNLFAEPVAEPVVTNANLSESIEEEVAIKEAPRFVDPLIETTNTDTLPATEKKPKRGGRRKKAT